MTLNDRERKALVVWAIAMLLGGIYWWSSNSTSLNAPKVSATPVDSIERAQKRLVYLRTAESTVAGKQAVLKQVSTELLDREKALLGGESASQAQAQLLEILQRVAKSQAPPLQVRQVELAQPRSFGEAYGLVTVSVTLDCRIEELVNFLAALGAQPEEVATEEIRFGTANARLKNMPVRLTVSGVVPRKLIPEKKGSAAF